MGPEATRALSASESDSESESESLPRARAGCSNYSVSELFTSHWQAVQLTVTVGPEARLGARRPQPRTPAAGPELEACRYRAAPGAGQMVPNGGVGHDVKKAVVRQCLIKPRLFRDVTRGLITTMITINRNCRCEALDRHRNETDPLRYSKRLWTTKIFCQHFKRRVAATR